MGVEQEEEEVMASNVPESERERTGEDTSISYPWRSCIDSREDGKLGHIWWNILLFEIPLFIHLRLAVLFITAPSFFHYILSSNIHTKLYLY